MELLTTRLQLRELTAADVEAVHHLHSLPAVDEFNTLGLPASLAVTEQLLADWLGQQQAKPRTSYIFYAQLRESKQFIGLLALTLGKAAFQSGEVWYKLLPTHWGQGLATEALTELLRFGFNERHLHRIEAGCAVDNSASIRVLEKVGMRREGRKRQNLPIRGQWVDTYFFAILDSDR